MSGRRVKAARATTPPPGHCRTCMGPVRETVGMVCQACGRDYDPNVQAPHAHAAAPGSRCVLCAAPDVAYAGVHTRPAPVQVPREAVAPGTFWNGERCDATRVNLRVAAPPGDLHPQYWARDLIGTVRPAVRVVYGGRAFYLDDVDGAGWAKVTTGGSPRTASRSLYGEEVFVR